MKQNIGFNYYISRASYMFNLLFLWVIGIILVFTSKPIANGVSKIIEFPTETVITVGSFVILSLGTIYSVYKIMLPKLVLSGDGKSFSFKSGFGKMVTVDWEDFNSIHYYNLTIYHGDGKKNYKQLVITCKLEIYRVNINNLNADVQTVFESIQEIVGDSIRLTYNHRQATR